MLENPVWTARIWEDGSFSLGYVPYTVAECEAEDPPSGYSEFQENLIAGGVIGFGILGQLERMKDNPEPYAKKQSVVPFGSSIAPNSHSDRSRRGRVGISTHGKKLVRNAALRLEREVGKNQLTFLTLTIPGIQQQGALEICRNWAEIVRVFQQKLKRMLQSHGLPGEMVGVTEVQEKRFKETNVPALHLHILFQGRRSYEKWALTPREIREAWKDVIHPYLPLTNGEFYWQAMENVQRVKHSASGYLGKYMSKGSEVVNALHEVIPDIVLPTCWYLCSNVLRRKVRAKITYFTSKTFAPFETMLTSDSICSDVLWLRPVDLDIGNGRVIRVGYIGRLSYSLLDTIRCTLNKDALTIPF